MQQGTFFELISIGSVVTTFALFYIPNKHGFHEYDIKITYTFLFGVVGLEFASLSMLICSDTTFAKIGTSKKHRRSLFKGSIFIKFFNKFKSESSPFALHILHARWSRSIFQYNLIDSWVGRWPKWIEKLFGLIPPGELFDDLKLGQLAQYSEKLGKLLFDELKQKLFDADDVASAKMRAARGDWALEHTKTGQDCRHLLPLIRDFEYDDSILLWHIATEICYYTEADEGTGPDIDESIADRVNTKVLSDYVLHLMIKQLNVMFAVAGFVEIRFQYTYGEMDEFLIKHCPDGSKTKITKESACKSLLSVGLEGRSDRGDREAIKPALLNARALARELQSNEKKYSWKIMSEVWAELLGYTAVHCGSYTHAQQLRKGGELITLVWLLMAQLGVHPHFRMVLSPRQETD